MKTGLAGTGNAGGWTVDIEEIGDAHGLTLGNKRYYLQIRPITLHEIENLLRFLQDPQPSDDQVFLVKCFGGAMRASRHDGQISLRIAQAESEYGTCLIELHVEEADGGSLAHALNEALEEAK